MLWCGFVKCLLAIIVLGFSIGLRGIQISVVCSDNITIVDGACRRRDSSLSPKPLVDNAPVAAEPAVKDASATSRPSVSASGPDALVAKNSFAKVVTTQPPSRRPETPQPATSKETPVSSSSSPRSPPPPPPAPTTKTAVVGAATDASSPAPPASPAPQPVPVYSLAGKEVCIFLKGETFREGRQRSRIRGGSKLADDEQKMASHSQARFLAQAYADVGARIALYMDTFQVSAQNDTALRSWYVPFVFRRFISRAVTTTTTTTAAPQYETIHYLDARGMLARKVLLVTKAPGPRDKSSDFPSDAWKVFVKDHWDRSFAKNHCDGGLMSVSNL